MEAKESFRWLGGPHRARWGLSKAAMVTVIDDREGDIYEKWARLPDKRTHLLTRACRDRAAVGGGTLFATMAGFSDKHSLWLDLQARPRTRHAPRACFPPAHGRARIATPCSPS